LESCSIGKFTFYKIPESRFRKNNCIRHIRTSFKKNDLCQFPPWEALTQHWESELLVEPKKIFQTDGVQSGICYDPVSFIPKYLERFLKRRALERSPLPPGDYNILFKVFSNLYVLFILYSWLLLGIYDLQKNKSIALQLIELKYHPGFKSFQLFP
jgi:hypothetical protein